MHSFPGLQSRHGGHSQNPLRLFSYTNSCYLKLTTVGWKGGTAWLPPPETLTLKRSEEPLLSAKSLRSLKGPIYPLLLLLLKQILVAVSF